MRTATLIASILVPLALVSSSCSTSPDTPRKTGNRFPIEQYEHEDREPTVIVHLESHRYHVTISASPIGPLYTVATPDGQILIENLTELEMHASDPDLYDKIFGRYAEKDPDFKYSDIDNSSYTETQPEESASAEHSQLEKLLGEDAALFLTEPTASAALISADVDPTSSNDLFDNQFGY